jgi:hypothetical protein
MPHLTAVILTEVRIERHEMLPFVILDPDIRQDDECGAHVS